MRLPGIQSALADVTCGAAVYFPSAEPPTPAAGLRDAERCGVRIEMLPPADGDRFAARLSHPSWGEAFVCSPRRAVRPALEDVAAAPWLSSGEKARIAACRSSLLVACVPPGAGHGPAGARYAPAPDDPDVCRAERKRLFRFARALLGTRGGGICDVASGRHWSPEGLDDELELDLPLDVEALYLIHAVQEDEPPQHGGAPAGRSSTAGRLSAAGRSSTAGTSPGRDRRIAWFHTHGLGAAGAVDLDVILPARSMLINNGDPMRFLAGLSFGGWIQPGIAEFTWAAPGGAISFVPAERWEREASEEHRWLRQDGGDHRTDRVVICDPLEGPHAAPGGIVRPSAFMSTMDLSRTAFWSPEEETARFAARAQATLPRMEAFREEFGLLVSGEWISIAVDAEGLPSGRETLSFKPGRIRGGFVEAVLVDEPHHATSLAPGAQGRWPVDRVVDWCLDTVAGPLTPRSGAAARILRENRETYLPILRAWEQHQAAAGDAASPRWAGRN